MDEDTIRSVGELVGIAAVVSTVLLMAAMWYASRHFASRESVEGCASRTDLNGVGSRLNALETVVINARDSADGANDRVSLLEERARQQWERTLETLERVSTTMETISKEQKDISRQHAEMARDLKHLFKRLDG